ncbi:hypothetical protein ACFP56_19470 [Paenibacillus septentrionalis]|uniref:DUF4025 domain-containing protein n=1 Tax=Paenibacillus septentrionalis TaxID=429342 RepID=A0ABW1V7S1_9BACL
MSNRSKKNPEAPDLYFEGRSQYEMDIDRMINEGLGGGYVTEHNGLIEETTVDTTGVSDGVAE